MGHTGWTVATGAAILVAAAALGGVALARGPDMLLPMAVEPGLSYPPPEAHPARFQAGDEQSAGHHRERKPRSASAGGRVCVRLCDGYFFPDSGGGDGEASCESQCPDAPVALYTMPSDRISDAVSVATGAPYSALPVAHRYETTFDATCTCHRDPGASRTEALLRDPTLRRGDLVMTPEGFKVFEGEDAGAAEASDFVALAHASGLSRGRREALTAMETPSQRRATLARASVRVDDSPGRSGRN